MNVATGIFVLVVVVGASVVGCFFPTKSLLLAPHAITVAAILAGIIASVQNILTARLEREFEFHNREAKVEKSEARFLLKGIYDQLFVYVLVICFAMLLIWLDPKVDEIEIWDRCASVFFMGLLGLSFVLTLRMPRYLKSLMS
ncbi:hypothetical protein [uncultured Tateyamaria sp.]|uniref:hypothetical protein n=1 Tax=uncultured Tateyamaria sp. TaxID=455651 RepID=UPI0026395C56|nr:hypothetical protein [uncultured Tateyamaria sp.]